MAELFKFKFKLKNIFILGKNCLWNVGGDVRGYTKYQSQGCPGNLLEFHDSNSAGNCAGLCNNRQLCVAFEYNNAVDGCYLKRVCDVNSLVPKSETEAAYIRIGRLQ